MRLRGISDGRRLTPTDELTAHEREVLAAALRASGTPDNGNGELDYTDRALLDRATGLGLERTAGAHGWRRVTELPFEANRGVHMVLGRVNGSNRLSVKGAPEAVLGGCVRRPPGGRTAEFDRMAMAEVVLATGLGSAGILAATVQTPGVSHFFGCRPLGPLDWAQALGSAAAASAGSQIAERVLTSRVTSPPETGAPDPWHVNGVRTDRGGRAAPRRQR